MRACIDRVLIFFLSSEKISEVPVCVLGSAELVGAVRGGEVFKFEPVSIALVEIDERGVTASKQRWSALSDSTQKS